MKSMRARHGCLLGPKGSNPGRPESVPSRGSHTVGRNSLAPIPIGRLAKPEAKVIEKSGANRVGSLRLRERDRERHLRRDLLWPVRMDRIHPKSAPVSQLMMSAPLRSVETTGHAGPVHSS